MPDSVTKEQKLLCNWLGLDMLKDGGCVIALAGSSDMYFKNQECIVQPGLA